MVLVVLVMIFLIWYHFVREKELKDSDGGAAAANGEDQ